MSATFEPELAQPTPRRIEAREGCALGCGLWAVRLFCMPHTLVGPFLVYQAAKATVLWVGLWLAGVAVEGRVVGKAEHPSRKGAYYTVEYAFNVDGIPYSGEWQPTAEEYAGIREGQPVALRVWEFSPEEGHRVEGRGMSGGSAGALWVMALFWNGIIGFVVWKFYYLPYRQRQLVRYGVPTAGIVRDLSVPDMKRPESLHVKYEYAVPAGHRTAGGVFKGSNFGSWHPVDGKLKPGDLITVLYDPKGPRRSLAYRFCDYKAVLPPGSAAILAATDAPECGQDGRALREASRSSLDPQHPVE
jgi:hypothetical protein